MPHGRLARSIRIMGSISIANVEYEREDGSRDGSCFPRLHHGYFGAGNCPTPVSSSSTITVDYLDEI